LNAEIELLQDLQMADKYYVMHQLCPENIDINWRFVLRLMELSEQIETFQNASVPADMIRNVFASATNALEQMNRDGKMSADGDFDMTDIDYVELGTQVVQSTDPKSLAKMLPHIGDILRAATALSPQAASLPIPDEVAAFLNSN
jgi:hypothetical protein